MKPQILIWQSWGDIEVYRIDTPEQRKAATDELLEICESEGFTTDLKGLGEVISWINEEVKHDWEMFEYLQISTIKEF